MFSFFLNKFIFSSTTKKTQHFHMISLKRRLTLKIIVSLVVFNFIVSITILKQQSQLTSLFKSYSTRLEFDDKDSNLLTTLNAYRRMFQNNNQMVSSSYNMNMLKKYFTTQKIDDDDDLLSSSILLDTHSTKNDYLFSRTSFYDLFNSEKLKLKQFYEPNILVNNENSCKIPDEENTIIILCLIHSHKDNYLRRQTMRDTWLKSLNNVSLLDLGRNRNRSLKLINKKIKLIHLFVVGNVYDNEKSEYDRIKLESEIYKDIIMIDTLESYKNLIYKHLAIINW